MLGCSDNVASLFVMFADAEERNGVPEILWRESDSTELKERRH